MMLRRLDTSSEESSSDEAHSSEVAAALFCSLMSECRHAAPEARLSARLRSDLEQLCPEARRSLMRRKRRGCPPLLVAVRRDSVPLAEYLVHVCGAQLEQRGTYGTHQATALWVAAVDGQMHMLRALADAGADMNAQTDSGSTPARSACYLGRLDVVTFLAERGADLSRPNHAGSTCLMNAVHEPRLVQYLLSRGVNANARDVHGRTALHHACKRRHLDTVRALLAAGADQTLRCNQGMNAIMYAAAAGEERVFALLEGAHTGRALADALVLLAATMLEDRPTKAHEIWSRALRVYASIGVRMVIDSRRNTARSRCAAWIANAFEPRVDGEVRPLARRAGGALLPALIAVDRVLGEAHPETSARIMRVAGHLAAGGFRREAACFYEWALRARISAGTLLHEGTAATLAAITQLYVWWYLQEEAREDAHRTPPTFQHIYNIFRLAADNFHDAQSEADRRPLCRRQAAALDQTMRCITHLLFAMLHVLDMEDTPACDERRLQVARSLEALVRTRPRSVRTGDTLLHLAVSRRNTLPAIPGVAMRPVRAPFPCELTARALLAVGASPRVRNHVGGTALLTAAASHNYSTPIIHALLAGGAHLDQPNAHGDTATALIAARLPRLCLLPPRLLCLAAAVAASLPLPTHFPLFLGEFLEMHRR